MTLTCLLFLTRRVIVPNNLKKPLWRASIDHQLLIIINWAVFFLVVTALYTGGLPARKLTRGPFFVEGFLRALSREACFREMLSRTLLLFSTSWNENCHIFMDTSSPSWAHLPLHWHIVPFMGRSSPAWAHLPCKDTWRGGWRDMVCFPRAFARLSPGYARDPEWKMPNQIHAALVYSKASAAETSKFKDWSQICLRRLLARRLSWSFREMLTGAYANL